ARPVRVAQHLQAAIHLRSMPMPVTYSSYLKLDELLSLQQPISDGPEHDETLFIVIHQVYELWFKELLHEIDYLKVLLEKRDTPRALHTLKRVLTILKVVVAQIDVLETMTPLEFLSFRERLESGSGFQSFQFRELEFVLGMKNAAALERYPKESPARRRLEGRLAEPTLWDAFLRFLGARRMPTLADLVKSPNPLAAHYSRFRVTERILLTGHSHQAWPDVAFEGQIDAWVEAAEQVDDKWSRAGEKASRVRRGYARLLGAAEGEIALGQNTHELLTRFLSALPLRERPRLVTTDGEFHALRRQLDRLAEEGVI